MTQELSEGCEHGGRRARLHDWTKIGDPTSTSLDSTDAAT
jgi:hypothetical protein